MSVWLNFKVLSYTGLRLLLSGLLLVVFSIASPYAFSQFAGGSGTADDPYLVANAEQLDQVRHHLSSHFKQTEDISLYSSGWLPVGAYATDSRFSGHYDGQNYTISGLNVQQVTLHYQGLFAALSNATIRNLNLVDVSVAGKNYTGALAGYATQSQLENIRVQGEVLGGSYVGGLLGWSYQTSLLFVRGDISVIGGDSVGGLVGVNQSNTAYYCSTEGQVSGSSSHVGGLFGQQQGGVTTDSYSLADVTGINYVGGLAGSTYGGGAHVYRSFSAGAVSSEGEAVGGLIGERIAMYGIATVADSFWDVDTSNQLESSGGEARTTAQMLQASNYHNFNFRKAWLTPALSGGYPAHQNLSQYAHPGLVDISELAGEGTPESPYLVTNAAELNAMRQDLSAEYQLVNDIDMVDTLVWNQGRGWEPVGTSTDRFAGKLEGNGFQLVNLVINRPNVALQGLLGRSSSGAVVKNLSLVDVNVHGSGQTGALAGQADSTEIVNLQVSGEITGKSHVGGLAGQTSSGTHIFYASTDVSVKGIDSLGGLVGVSQSARVYYSAASGSVLGDRHVGGMFGQMQGGVTTDSYSHATATGSDYVGGLTGSTYGGGSYIYRSYSTGAVSGTGEHVGGFAGAALALYGVGIVEDSYWDTQSSNQLESPWGEGRTTAQMQQASNYLNYNFFNAWAMPQAGVGYPGFQDLMQHAQPETIELSDLQGEGSLHSPYLISNASELNAMRLNVAAHYRLVNDIDLQQTVAWNLGMGWEAVGSSADRFTGSLDGKNRAILNLTVNRPDINTQGLFGISTVGASIQDLQLERVNIQGGTDTGGLIGNVYNAISLDNVQVSGEVTGKNETGGLLGRISSSNSQVLNSSAAVSVKGYNNVGGLIGLSQSVPVKSVHSSGHIRGNVHVGGLIGQQQGGTTTDAFSLASVNGEDYIGGLVGSTYGGSAEINRAYSAGPVQASGSPVGGLVGARVANYGIGTVLDSYWDMTTSGQNESDGGEGHVTADLTYPYAADVYEGWDFSKDWRLDIKLQNQGYPYLRGKMVQSTKRSGLPVWIYLQ